MMDEITIEEDIWKRGIASDSSVQGSVVKEKVSFWQTRNCQTDDSSSLQGSVVKEKVAFWQAHNGHPSAAKRKSSSSTNHRQTKSFEDSFIPPTIEFNRKKKFFDIERCLDDPSRELPRRHDQATPAAGLCHNNIFRQPKHKLQKKVAKTSPLASVPFNDSLFVRVDKELDAMKKDGTVGITQAGIEEEIVFECDSMLYHSESDVVTVASEEDDSSLVIDSNNNSNDYHHHKSPHSLRSQQSMFQNEYLSPNGRKSKSTRDRRCFDNSAFDCNRKAHPFSLKDSSISSSRSPGFKFALCIASLLLIAIGITGGCLLAFENSNQQSPVSLDHTKSDEYGVLLTSNSIRESLKVLFGSISGFEKLNDVSKPQNKTLEWMLDHTTLSDVDNREALVERYVLALVFFSLNGKEWDLERNFLSSRHVCEWNDQPFETGWKDEDLKHGVFCDKDNRVVHLLLENNHLQGSLPFEIGKLEKLQSLLLNDNQIEGQIPTQIGDLKELVKLDLANNNLHGELPSDIGRLSMLKTLNVYDNNLGGQLPCEIEDLNLEVVNIRSNEFRGNIDPYFCNKDYNYNSFWADCHQGGETIATTTGINEEEEEPYVECLCCTVCCNKETCCSDNGCWTLGHN